MQVLPADQCLEKAVEVIRSGGIVAHATETCYGFACDLTNPQAVAQLFLLKNRPEGQSVSALFPSVEEAKKWVEWNEKAEELATQYLPGPLTIIFPLKSGKRLAVSGELGAVSGEQTLGVRVSSYPVAQKLVELAGVPLSTTSANLHRKSSTYSAQEIVDQFSDREIQPDLILDSGPLPPTPSSTVVLIQNGQVRTVRQGSVSVS